MANCGLGIAGLQYGVPKICVKVSTQIYSCSIAEVEKLSLVASAAREAWVLSDSNFRRVRRSAGILAGHWGKWIAVALATGRCTSDTSRLGFVALHTPDSVENVRIAVITPRMLSLEIT